MDSKFLVRRFSKDFTPSATSNSINLPTTDTTAERVEDVGPTHCLELARQFNKADLPNACHLYMVRVERMMAKHEHGRKAADSKHHVALDPTIQAQLSRKNSVLLTR